MPRPRLPSLPLDHWPTPPDAARRPGSGMTIYRDAETCDLYLGTWVAPSEWCNRPMLHRAGFLLSAPAPVWTPPITCHAVDKNREGTRYATRPPTNLALALSHHRYAGLELDAH